MAFFGIFGRNGKKERSPFAAPRRRATSLEELAAKSKVRSNGHRIPMNHSSRMLPGDAKVLNSIGRKMVRMFEAALTSNLNSDMPISLTSSNAEILTSLIGVRSRARTLERNNGYAVGMIYDQMRNVAGHDPFRLEMQVGKTTNGKFVAEPETNEEIMRAWEDAGRQENCTVRRDKDRKELYWTAAAAMFRDGGILYRHHGALNDKKFPYNKLGYAIEEIEYDRLDQNWCRPKTAKGNDNEIQFGKELDEYKGTVAYWILTRHPGDIFAFSNVASYRERVPAKDIIALWDIRTRAEQYTGMSRMASIIRLLHQLEQFDIAHITAALTTCCKSIWIEKQFPSSPEFVPDHIREEIVGGQGGFPDGVDSGWGGGDGQRLVNTTPGEVNELEWGQKVVAPDPHFPVESAPQFKRDILRCVAAGSTVWYNTLAQDMESVNFASGRLGEGASRDMAMMSQEHVIDMLVRPHFETWLKYWLLSDQTKLNLSRYDEFCKAAVFNGRRWAYTNPLQDVQADILTVEAGLDSRSHIISESPRGGNAEEVNREIQADRESDKLHNLDFSAADVTKPTISKGLPGEDKPNPLDAQQGEQEPDAKTQPGGKANGKTKGKSVDLDRLERTLSLLASTDEEFKASDDYKSSLKFISAMRKMRKERGEA
jgi:lambda family phage portal protein